MTSQETYTTLNRLASEFASAFLGGSVKRPATLENYWTTTVNTPAFPMELRLNAGRVTVAPETPTYTDREGFKRYVHLSEVVPHKEGPTLSITVAASRGGKAIAKEACRRLSPSAAPIYALAVAKAKQHEDYDTATVANAKRIAAALGEHIDPYRTTMVYVANGPRLCVQGDSVRVEAFNVDVETAIQIAKLAKRSAT